MTRIAAVAGHNPATWSRVQAMIPSRMPTRARGHRSLKRGGGVRPVSLDAVELGTEDRAELLVALDEALDRLKAVEPRQAG